MTEKNVSPQNEKTSQDNRSEAAFPLWAKTLLIAMAVALAVQTWLIVGLTDQSDSENATAVADYSAREETSVPGIDSTAGPGRPLPGSIPPPIVLDDNSGWLGIPYNPTTWDPFYEMQRMRERMDRIFGEAFGRFARSERFSGLSQMRVPFSPQIDLRDTGDAYEVEVNLPGIEESEVKIGIEGQTLRLSGQVEEQKETTDETGQILRRERHFGRFDRSIVLPEPVKGEEIETNVNKGVLRIIIPKASEPGKGKPEEETDS